LKYFYHSGFLSNLRLPEVALIIFKPGLERGRAAVAPRLVRLWLSDLYGTKMPNRSSKYVKYLQNMINKPKQDDGCLFWIIRMSSGKNSRCYWIKP